MTDRNAWTDADLARLRLEGLEHLVRLRSGSATQRDAAAFLAWRGTSAAHEEAFRSAVGLQRLVREAFAERVEEGTPRSAEVIAIETVPRRRLSRRGVLSGALAASFAGGLFVVGRSLDMVPDPATLRADVSTAAGERRLVKLAGGATVDLNTRTSIVLRKDLAMPAVELIGGEALLTSAPGGAAALVAGKGTSIGRSGRFNARRDGDEVCITCLAGTVDLAWQEQQRRLRAGEEVRYDGERVGAVEAGIDASVLTAWRQGTLIFRDMPMRTVVAEINRYRHGKVLLANDRLGARLLTGTYRIDGLDAFFRQAELGLGVKVMHLPGDVVVLS
ncbi:DUF4880 domain-containing protein [Sphingomonas sp. H39-1-10]|uniref:FecR family protein n=1 Tax=Sphingomonas pollutisoli TaxID=3030829 RepID=UPI0023B95B83|nr:FecR domain-containing protein [Sphingomonas pollutisoli]MDF0490369.1 DUF4880 domain-containing protein [Sphingomonas pollutisoli]